MATSDGHTVTLTGGQTSNTASH